MNVYPFIEAEKSQRRNVKRACVLLKVSRSAFYADRTAGPSQRERDDAELTDAIMAVHERVRWQLRRAPGARRAGRPGPPALPQADRPAHAPGRPGRPSSPTLEEDHHPQPGRCGSGRCDPPGLHRRRHQDQHKVVRGHHLFGPVPGYVQLCWWCSFARVIAWCGTAHNHRPCRNARSWSFGWDLAALGWDRPGAAGRLLWRRGQLRGTGA